MSELNGRCVLCVPHNILARSIVLVNLGMDFGNSLDRFILIDRISKAPIDCVSKITFLT